MKSSIRLSFCVFCIFVFWSFLVFSRQTTLIWLDMGVYHLIQSIVSFPILAFFKMATHLGAAIFVIPFILASACWVWFKKKNKLGFYLFVLIALALLLNVYLKLLFLKDRPTFLIEVTDTRSYSYPSGHALAGILLAYYLGWFFREMYPSYIKIRLIVTGVIGILIPFSRVVLGVHWISDVIGGVLLAFFYLTLYEWWFKQKKFPSAGESLF